MKRVCLMVLTVMLSIFLGACTNVKTTSQEDISRNMIERVRLVETLDYKFNELYINYEQYINGLEGLFIETYTKDMHYDRSYVPPQVDLKNMTNEERIEIQEKREELGYIPEISVEISDVYTDKDNGRKYVYTRAKIIDKKSDFIDDFVYYYTKRYMLKEYNNEWLIVTIEDGFYDERQLNAAKANNKYLPYTRFNNIEVTYTEVFNPLE